MGALAVSFRGVRISIIICLIGTAASCGHSVKTVEKKQTPSNLSKPKPPLDIYENVSEIDVDCVSDGPESCNGIDDNCNGVIDEECGYNTGEVQIAVGWDNGSDIDLYVTDPEGETICFRRGERTSSSGGQMDQDARGDCRDNQKIKQVENVYWEDASKLRGEINVELHYFSPCGSNEQTTATVSVVVRGKVLGVFRRVLLPEERASVVKFTLK